MDTLDLDSGFRGTVSLQLSGLPAGVSSQTAVSTTITNNTIVGNDGFGDTIFGTFTTLQLSADGTTPLGNFPLTVTATSGSLSHSVTITVDVVDSVPANTLRELEVAGCATCSFAETFGGTPALGTVYVNVPAPASGTVVALSSSKPAAASVPASVTVTYLTGSGSGRDAFFTVTLARNAPAGQVTISASLNGHTTTAKLTILGGGGQQ